MSEDIDLAAVRAEHEPGHICEGRWRAPVEPLCLPYRLATLALDLENKIADVSDLADEYYIFWTKFQRESDLRVAKEIRTALEIETLSI